jgi:hypothetical protein
MAFLAAIEVIVVVLGAAAFALRVLPWQWRAGKARA